MCGILTARGRHQPDGPGPPGARDGAEPARDRRRRSSPPGSASPTAPYAATSRSCARPGIPVESTRGRYGGYRVGRGLRVPPLMFTATEALALVMAVLEGHDAADPEDPVGSALGKIVRVLPEPLAGPVDAIRRVTARGWDVGVPDVETTAALVQASATGAGSGCGYRLGPDREREMDVDPWAVVVRHRRWYLLGWSHSQGRAARAARRPGGPGRAASRDASRRRPTSTRPRARGAAVAGLALRGRGRDRRADGRRRSTGCRGRSAGSRRWGSGATGWSATTDEPDWYAAQLAALPYVVPAGRLARGQRRGDGRCPDVCRTPSTTSAGSS